MATDTKALEAQIAALKAENAKLNAKVEAKQQIKLKVADKGGLSVYGLNARFPVTLYAQQWERLLAPEMVKQIHDFILANAATLSRKE